jgi:hypothetical protein
MIATLQASEVTEMKQTTTNQQTGEEVDVAELLERRARVQEWLDRLDSQSGTADPRVVERIRADYQQRLAETLDALSARRDALLAQLDGAHARLEEVGHAHREALDALEEARLRSAIGELDEVDWDERRPVLEKGVADAAARESDARDAATRLAEILGLMDDREMAPPAVEPVDAGIETVEIPPAEAEEPRGAEPFLAEIDRALSHDDGVPASEGEVAGDVPGETSPRPGLKCAECGYTNDLSAWFCGVCGADVG